MSQNLKSSNQVVHDHIIGIMDTAFSDLKSYISMLEIEDSLTETDLDQLASYHELLKLKQLSDSLLKQA